MRQRITYLQEPNDSIDPKLLDVTTNSISTKELKGAREERITLGLTEGLPVELYQVLIDSHELHVRWVAEEDYESISPLVARLSPGLHVFYTPQSKRTGEQDEDGPSLCHVLRKVFGEIDCLSPEESFTTLPTIRFSHSTTHQYYSHLPSLTKLESYIHNRVCASLPPTLSTSCLTRLSTLQGAATLDISYTSISHAVTITAYFPSEISNINITHTHPSSRLEVGMLSVSPAIEPSELSLGGFLTVLGEDDHPRATLFSFPSRHHLTPSGANFSSHFNLPTGLHPALSLRISDYQAPLPSEAGCRLHAHLTLPKTLFLDRHQFSDPLFLTSKNLSALHYITKPVDLEAPSYAESLWGSTALLELSPPSPSSSSPSSSHTPFTASIPTHLRYLPPTASSHGLTRVSIPYPALFWACTAEEGTKFSVNPFDRVNLGYDGLFGPRTIFYHLTPVVSESSSSSINNEAHSESQCESGRLVVDLQVPVLDLDRAGYVEGATALGVFLGLAWVCWCLWVGYVRSGYGPAVRAGRAAVVGKEKKMK